MAPSTIVCAVAFGCITAIYISRRFLGDARHAGPLPPGPLGLPFFGNVIGMKRSRPWLTFHEWSKKYGKLVYARLFGRDIIVINSEEIAKAILGNHSSNNSDRPCFVTTEMCGVDFATALLPYGERWRMQRRFFHQTYRNETMSRFLPLQHDKACQFLRQLLRSPEEFRFFVFEYASSVVLNSTYDYDPSSYRDGYIEMMVKVLESGQEFVRPDVLLIFDAFYLMLKLPTWFPGMSFKKKMLSGNKLVREYVEMASKYSLQRVLDSSLAPFMVQDAMRSVEEKGNVPDESWSTALKEAAATSCLVGSHTSRSLLMSFFLLMMSHPGVQEKAQAQLDAVVPKDRLPTLADRPSLPFIDAIFREILRIRPVIPMAAPHAAVDDMVYDGFHIPKGSIIIANVWAMAHDESRYPNPDMFLPERFLNDDGSLKPNDVEFIAYGFGRRNCVGRHFADSSLFSVIAKVLSVFKISKPLDKNGVEMDVVPQFTTGGFSMHPLPFPCRIVPRVSGMNTAMLEELISATTL